jgi:hypothetical protein
VGPRARRDGVIRGGRLGGARPVDSGRDPVACGDGQGRRARRFCVGWCRSLGVASPGAHAFLDLVLDLELDAAASGGLEGYGRVQEDAEEERQERPVRPHALILSCPWPSEPGPGARADY